MDNSGGDFNVFGNQDFSELFRSPNRVIFNIVRCNDSKESTNDISKNWGKYKQVVPPRTVGHSKQSKTKRKQSLREPKLFLSCPEVRNHHIFLFEALTQRLYSYGNWPKSAKIWPQELAEAGFFYLGNNLNLKCPSCGLQTNINDWKPTDKALDLHALLRPKCEYIKSIGYSFDKPKIDDKNLVVPDGIQLRYPEYSVIDLRINSFTTWIFHSKQSPKTLAHSGYFYTGKDDIVRCFCCDLGLAEWDASDDPWREHARHSHKCWFLNQMKGKEFIDGIQADWKKIYTPKHPAFEDKHTRMATFKGVWRTDIVQTADLLADAGFFYEGEEDTVRCHYCDGGLRHWEENNIPWEEHARWFPFCKFVVKMKGREFIDEVKVKYEVQYAQESLDNESPLVNDATPAQNNEPVKKSLLEMGFTLTDVTYAINEYTKHEGNTSYTVEELLAILVERHEANKLQRTFTAEAVGIHREETEQDTEAIVAANRELKKSIMCIRCHTNEKCMLFVNCGHRVTCESCSNQIDYCPYCDVKIKSKLKTFLS